VEAVDTLIEKLAGNITDLIEQGSEIPSEVAEKTKALAELISARASLN
jgi:hypothetical protein